jgi:YVTN family beta-propeller protein
VSVFFGVPARVRPYASAVAPEASRERLRACHVSEPALAGRPRIAAVVLGVALAVGACGGGGAPTWDSRLPAGQPRVFAVDNYPDGAGLFWVSVVDPRTNRVVRRFRVGDRPHHIYPIPGTTRAYVTHFVGNAIEVLDLRADRVLGLIRGTGAGPRHLSLSADGRSAYTDDFDGGTVTIIDTRKDAVIAKVPVGRNPNYNILSADGRRLFQANAGDNVLSVIDTTSRRVEATVKVGTGPFDVALTPDGSTLVAANAGSNTASIVDVRSLAVRAQVPIGGQIDPAVQQKLNVRVTDDGRYAWIGNQAGGSFSVIDIASGTRAAVHPTDKGADILYQLRSGPQAGWGVTTARYGRSIALVRPDNPAIAPRLLPTAEGSHNVTRTPDERTAYVSDRIGNAVSVIDLASFTEIARIPVGNFPDGIAYVWFQNGIAHSDTGIEGLHARPS